MLIQNRLLGLYYTTLNAYCEEFGFPSPPPPMEEVIADWNAMFGPAQRDLESLSFIARGRASRQPMNVGNESQSRIKPALSPMNLRDGFRRSTTGLISKSNNSTAQPSPRNPSPSSIPPSPAPSEQSGRRPDYLTPTDFTTATVLGRSPGLSPHSPRARPDYFDGGATRTPGVSSSMIRSSASQQALRDGIAKKKPPPPPPVKRFAAPAEFVIALYDFVGQGQGDLSFREGDRIKIVKKTATDQDWWVGECGGVKGNFPANYCKPA